MKLEQQNQHLGKWLKSQELAEEMQPMIGKIYRNYGVILRMYNRPLINISTIQLLKDHRYVRQFEGTELPVEDSFEVLKAMSQMELGPARVDLGKLTMQWIKSGKNVSAADFVREKLADIIDDKGGLLQEPQDIVLYGFGRIGRILARLLIEKTGPGNKLRLRAIVVRKGQDGDLQKRASLLRRDSVHGPFNGTITVDEENCGLIANGCFIKVIYADSPDKIDYTDYDIDNAIVIDNTGKWRDEDGLGLHLKANGASKALLTAPGKGDIKNIVYGVNDKAISDNDTILSAASCTTNAITPVLKALNDKYGIKNGHVETVHSYTNDQNLIDNFHKGERRGRSAPLNMVLTETGAAKAVAKALPELEGKLTGNAIRVPTPNVSMAVLNVNLDTAVDTDTLNDYLRDVSLNSSLQDQIDFTASTEVVSTDLVGSRHAGIIDSKATITSGNSCVLYVWYDNEFGYSCQVVRTAQKMAGLSYKHLP
ncbi:glyceraldehyde 3-phosphate dehydrogenase [gamma proteobacterium HTCC5015]|nr:glyceraldehyde 3-phosphate dehydrogenase [gamma proteobacterium HTCC5015]